MTSATVEPRASAAATPAPPVVARGRRARGDMGRTVRTLLVYGILFLLVIGPLGGLVYQSFVPSSLRHGYHEARNTFAADHR